MKLGTRLIIAIGALFLILGSFALYSAWPLLQGTDVVLATQPVDPFDPLRGQYITIRYEISTVTLPTGIEPGDPVYVSLQEDAEGIWRSSGVSGTEPEGLFIRGIAKNSWGSNVEYGIEQYFFERGAEFSTQNITVHARVSSGGRARIVELLQNSKPLVLQYRE